MMELVEKVLEAARTETGRITLDTQPVSLGAVARDALEIYAPIAERAGISLALVDRLGDAVVAADRIRFGQVVGNLLENAIRHSPSGGTVTVELSATTQAVHLAVRDQGSGIPVELRERLFERFVQGTGPSGSLGLGLYVAHELVKLHAGRILIEDVVPHGAALNRRASSPGSGDGPAIASGKRSSSRGSASAWTSDSWTMRTVRDSFAVATRVWVTSSQYGSIRHAYA